MIAILLVKEKIFFHSKLEEIEEKLLLNYKIIVETDILLEVFGELKIENDEVQYGIKEVVELEDF